MTNPQTGAHEPLLLEAGESEAAAQSGENPLLLIHRVMRGRYKYAIPLAVVFAAVFAVAGYFAVPPLYTSEGLVHIAPTKPRVIYTTEESQVPPMFDSFVAAQATLMRGRRVLDRAVEDRELLNAGWPTGVSGVARLADNLTVIHPRGGQILRVQVSEQNPAQAQAAVNAVLRAYDEFYGEQAQLQKTGLERAIEAERRKLEDSIKDIVERQLATAEHYNVDLLERVHAQKIGAIEGINARLDALDVAIRMEEARIAGRELQEGDDEAATTFNREMLAAMNPELATLIGRQREIKTRRDSLAMTLGPRHVQIRRFDNEIAVLEGQIEAKVQQLIASGGTATASGEEGGAPFDLSTATLEQMRTQRASLLKERDRFSREAAAANAKLVQIRALQDEEARQRVFLSEAQNRLRAVQVESRNSREGRISIEQWGDRPVSPSKDRRIPLAVAGAGFGAGAGGGLVFLFGLLHRGYRYTDELEHVGRWNAPLLGALPDVSSSDPEREEAAALSVHHLRNMLLLHPPPNNPDPKVYTITSAGSGDGKTSLTLSLGMSFAASGHRTLLIDADLLGRGLTRALQLENAEGLAEAIRSGDRLNGELHETSFANLYATPAGDESLITPEQMAKRDIRRILNEVRERFDVVIIDTGPLLGSLEANLVAGLSDSVMLAVTRGQDSKLVDACLARLERIGVHCAGLVFNRAEPQDFERSFASGSVSSTRSVQSRRAEEGSVDATRRFVKAIESSESGDDAVGASDSRRN